VLSQLRSGGVEFFHPSTGILSTLVPVTSICGIGFAMPDTTRSGRAMDGDLGAAHAHRDCESEHRCDGSNLGPWLSSHHDEDQSRSTRPMIFAT